MTDVFHPPPNLSSLSRPVGTSFIVHTGLSLGVWALGATTGRVDLKDCLWPSGMVTNAWYQAVGIPIIRYGLPCKVVLRTLPWRQRLLLVGSTVWGLRLFYHIAQRAHRRGTDDPRYAADKKTRGYHLRSLAAAWLPEALFQTLITLPFTAPFRDGFAHYERVLGPAWGWTDALAVGLWSAGFAMEVLADWQLERAQARGETRNGLCKRGMWSLVRHPNYLGDFLVHLSFPLLTLGTPAFHPLLFLGPFADYVFLRFIGGDKGTEDYQEAKYEEAGNMAKLQDLREYRRTHNAFWPALREVKNVWTWVLLACGAAGAALEAVVRGFVKPVVL